MSQTIASPTRATSRTATEHTFRTSDGVELFYRAWAPASESRRGVVLFHRGHEHSARWQEFIDRIALDDFWFFAWDARGHGRSPGDRGYAESFGRMVRDAEEFVRHLSDQFDIPVENLAVVAQSVGAVLATTWVHDYAPPIRALAIATPALRVKLYMPLKGLSDGQIIDRDKVRERLGVWPEQVIEYKALVGDASDNYPGITGIGPKTAVKLLEEFKTFENVVKKSGNQKVIDGYEGGELSKRLATIKTDAPVTFDSAKSEVPSTNKITEVFKELGYKSLMKRAGGDGEVNQIGLFDK